MEQNIIEKLHVVELLVLELRTVRGQGSYKIKINEIHRQISDIIPVLLDVQRSLSRNRPDLIFESQRVLCNHLITWYTERNADSWA